MMANHFNPRGAWRRPQLNTGYQGMTSGSLQNVTTEELCSEIRLRLARRVASAAANNEDHSPEQMGREEPQPENEISNYQHPGETFRQGFWAQQRSLGESNDLYAPFNDAGSPAWNVNNSSIGESAGDIDYRPGLNVAMQNSTLSRGKLPFPARNFHQPLLQNSPMFAERRGRGHRGRGFQNRGFFGRRGRGQHQFGHYAPHSWNAQPRFHQRPFTDDSAANDLGQHHEGFGPRGQGFRRRNNFNNPNFRLHHQPLSSFDCPPSQNGHCAPVLDSSHRDEGNSEELSMHGVFNQTPQHRDTDYRQIQPAYGQMGPQFQNTRSLGNSNFENNRRFDSPIRNRPPMFNDQNCGNNQRFEPPLRGIARWQIPNRIIDAEPRFNQFGTQFEDNAPSGSVISGTPPFAPMPPDDNHRDPPPLMDSDLRQPCLQAPLDLSSRRMNNRLASNRMNIRLRRLAGRKSRLLVGRARQVVRLSAARRAFSNVRRLRRLNGIESRHLQNARLRMRLPLSNSLGGNRNPRPGTSAGFCRQMLESGQDINGIVFLSGFSNGRPHPTNKLRNFDLEGVEEEKLPPPEEDWDAEPPAPPFFFGQFVKSKFMIANAAPRKKIPLDEDQHLATRGICFAKPSEPEVVDIIDDNEDKGRRCVKSEVDHDESEVHILSDQDSGSVNDTVSPNIYKSSRNTMFLVDLGMSSDDDDSMSCQIISDSSLPQNPIRGGSQKKGKPVNNNFQRYFEGVLEDVEENLDNDDVRDESRSPSGQSVLDEIVEIESLNSSLEEEVELHDRAFIEDRFNADALEEGDSRGHAPEGDDFHDNALEGDDFHNNALEGDDFHDNALEGDDFHDNALEGDDFHDNALEGDDFHDNALEGDDFHDNALEGDNFHDDDFEGAEFYNFSSEENELRGNATNRASHHDSNEGEENSRANDVDGMRNFEDDASQRDSLHREDSREKYVRGNTRKAQVAKNRCIANAQQPSSKDSESETDDESVCELDLMNIHPDPDCPEDFLDIDDNPGALPIPTGNNQANRPDVMRKRVYNVPAPPGLAAPPSPNNFSWEQGVSRTVRPPMFRKFIKHSHLIKMHHQSPSFDILHQVFPDDCNSGMDAELGHGCLDSEASPRCVECLEGIRVTSIAVGGWHSAAVTFEGDLYTWGWNESGQLGLPTKQEVQDDKAIVLQATPTCVQFPEDVIVQKVCCGSRHTLVLSDVDALWAFGWNSYGQLGASSPSFSGRPLRVEFFSEKGFKVSRIWCGGWSSLVETTPSPTSTENKGH